MKNIHKPICPTELNYKVIVKKLRN